MAIKQHHTLASLQAELEPTTVRVHRYSAGEPQWKRGYVYRIVHVSPSGVRHLADACTLDSAVKKINLLDKRGHVLFYTKASITAAK